VKQVQRDGFKIWIYIFAYLIEYAKGIACAKDITCVKEITYAEEMIDFSMRYWYYDFLRIFSF
jgi:hypothetical protein